MPYADKEDLVARFGEDELVRLADIDGDDEADDVKLDGALNDASELINSYVGKRYSVPIATAPPLIKRICCDIARYYLAGSSALEIVENNYKAAIDLLKNISNGKATLGISENVPSSSGKIEVLKTDADRVFTEDTLKAY